MQVDAVYMQTGLTPDPGAVRTYPQDVEAPGYDDHFLSHEPDLAGYVVSAPVGEEDHPGQLAASGGRRDACGVADQPGLKMIGQGPSARTGVPGSRHLRSRVRYSIGACMAGLTLTLSMLPSVHLGHQAVNNVEVVNHRPDLRRAELGWQEAMLDGRNVVAQDSAVAFNDCSGCLAESVAIQIVLVQPDLRAPASQDLNLDATQTALATNEYCSGCQAVALAYQFVVANQSDWMSITPIGRAELTSLRQSLETTVDRKPPVAVLQAEAQAVAGSIQQVLATQLTLAPAITAGSSAHATPNGLDPAKAARHASAENAPRMRVRFAEQNR